MVEKHSSVLIIEAVTEYEKADKAEKEILKLIDSLKNTITEKEINKVKNIFETDLLFSLESVQGVNKSLGSFEIYGDCKCFLSYLENILNENLVNINSALTKYLKPQRSSVVKYLPEKKKNYACKMQ